MSDYNTSSDSVFVYVLKAGDTAVKIGITDNLKKRLNSIQSHNHEHITLAYAWELESRSQAEQVERLLHVMFEEYNIHGEWFRLDTEVVKRRTDAALQLASSLAGIDFEGSGLEERDIKPKADRKVYKHQLQQSVVNRAYRNSDARERVRQYLRENPQDEALTVRQLADRIGVGKTIAAEMVKVFRQENAS